MAKFYFFWMRDWAWRRVIGTQCSNSELSWNIAQFLGGKGEVHLGNMGDETPAAVTSDDVLIGHFGPWANKSFSPYIYAIAPWPGVTESWYQRWYKQPQCQECLRRAKTIFGLCGSHQLNLTEKDPILAGFRGKLSPINTGLDRAMYPFAKRDFNPPGKRGFYYLGNPYAEKNTGAMIEAAKKTGSRLILADGRCSDSGSITEIGWIENGNPDHWRRITEECDFCLGVPLIDCQPVWVLEGISRGFVPVVSPAAAFECEYAIRVPDPTELALVEMMAMVQAVPDAELHIRQWECMRYLEEHHSWGRFCDQIWERISLDRSGGA